MSRFFVDSGAEIGKIIIIKGDDFHHIKNVLRSRPGDTITLCDGKGTDFSVVVERIYMDCIEALVESVIPSENEPKIKITLYQGMPKADKLEFIIQKCVELGIFEIVPVMTRRAVVKLDETSVPKKVERWQKIAFEAAKQSNRGVVPKIHTPITFLEAVERAGLSDICIIPYEKEKENHLKGVLSKSPSTISSLSFFIGPEGGFDDEEVMISIKNRIKPVTLGPRILRTETAGLSLLSIIMYELGDIG